MSLAHALSDTQVMVTRSTRRSLRDPEAFFTALMLPIVLMLLFVYIFGGALNTGGKYVNYVVPGLIVLCAGFGAGTTAVAVATDMSNGIVDRFRSMPIASSSIMIGHIAASLARNLIATTLVIGVGLGVGWRPTASPADWTAAAGMIVLFILTLSWLAAAAGLLARSAEAANSLSFILIFIPTSAPRSCLPTPCPAHCAGSQRTSPSRRSSRPCAASGWGTPPPAQPPATKPGSRSHAARPSSPSPSPPHPGCSATGPAADRPPHHQGDQRGPRARLPAAGRRRGEAGSRNRASGRR